jgi:hypothetical protein
LNITLIHTSTSIGDSPAFKYLHIYIDIIIAEMTLEKVNIKNKLSGFSDYWNPRIVGELNGQHVKLAKAKGEFVWHQHDHEDEIFRWNPLT